MARAEADAKPEDVEPTDEELAAVAKSALPQAITTYGFDRRPGVNR